MLYNMNIWQLIIFQQYVNDNWWNHHEIPPRALLWLGSAIAQFRPNFAFRLACDSRHWDGMMNVAWLKDGFPGAVFHGVHPMPTTFLFGDGYSHTHNKMLLYVAYGFGFTTG